MRQPSHRHVPTQRELAVWRAHLETFEIVRARIDSRLQKDSQLSSGEYRVLVALSEAKDRSLRSSALAASLEWQRSRLSSLLGRMEKRGLVVRRPCSEDARGTEVALSPAGARAFAASTVPHLKAVKEIFSDGVSAEELEHLAAVVASLRTHLNLESPGEEEQGPAA